MLENRMALPASPAEERREYSARETKLIEQARADKVKQRIDYLFANPHEALALIERHDDLATQSIFVRLLTIYGPGNLGTMEDAADKTQYLLIFYVTKWVREEITFEDVAFDMEMRGDL